MIFVPRRVFFCVAVPILAHPRVLLGPETSERVEVLLMYLVRSFEHTEATVLRPVGRQVGDALVQLETVDLAWVLVDVYGSIRMRKIVR
jgi:hypothetical protein